MKLLQKRGVKVGMGIIKSMRLIKLSKKIEKINSLNNTGDRVNKCRELFIDILNNEDLYIVATPKTTKEEWENDKCKPYIAEANQGELYFLRIFTDRELACACARRIESVIDDGTELVMKVGVEQLVSVVKDYFIMGIDGVLLNDGEDWITFNCEAFLAVAFIDVLNMPKSYNKDFVNTVKAIYDIAKKRIRLVAPSRFYEDITVEDVLKGKGELYTFSDELLLLEYYDKYKVENIFKEKVYWIDMDIEIFYSIIEVAYNKNIRNIKIVYSNKEANGSPKEILELLKSVGFSPCR